jgi:hypothetical protein
MNLPDMNVSLECRCADDRGAGYKVEEDLTPEDLVYIEDYEETRARQQLVEELVGQRLPRRAYVDALDTDDEDSQHSDCYVRFNLRDLPEIVAILEEVGLEGDILDVPDDLPLDLARYIEDTLYWTIEFRHVPGWTD